MLVARAVLAAHGAGDSFLGITVSRNRGRPAFAKLPFLPRQRNAAGVPLKRPAFRGLASRAWCFPRKLPIFAQMHEATDPFRLPVRALQDCVALDNLRHQYRTTSLTFPSSAASAVDSRAIAGLPRVRKEKSC